MVRIHGRAAFCFAIVASEVPDRACMESDRYGHRAVLPCRSCLKLPEVAGLRAAWAGTRTSNPFEKKIAEDASVLRERYCDSTSVTLRRLRSRLGCFLPRLSLALPAADERQGVGGVEGELANRGFARRAQGDINPAIARHPDDHDVLENPLPLFWRQLRITLHFTLYLVIVQVVVLAKGLGVDVGLGNALFYQEALDAIDSAFGQRLVVFLGTTMISVAAKNQVRIRFALEVLLEVGCQRDQRLLLSR